MLVQDFCRRCQLLPCSEFLLASTATTQHRSTTNLVVRDLKEKMAGPGDTYAKDTRAYNPEFAAKAGDEDEYDKKIQEVSRYEVAAALIGCMSFGEAP